MCERLKQSVLKTDVRETVPGVRIPLPPPRSPCCVEISPLFCEDRAKSPPIRRFLFSNRTAEKARPRRDVLHSPPFSLVGKAAVRFPKRFLGGEGNAIKDRSCGEGDLTPNKSPVRSNDRPVQSWVNPKKEKVGTARADVGIEELRPRTATAAVDVKAGWRMKRL